MIFSSNCSVLLLLQRFPFQFHFLSQIHTIFVMIKQCFGMFKTKLPILKLMSNR